jgi:hypothetical protein
VSFRVLVIPEDATYNGYILKPLVERLLVECGKRKAMVHVLSNSKLVGYESVKHTIRAGLADRVSGYNLWLFLPDSDLVDRSKEFAALEDELAAQNVRLLCCAAVPEVEAWLLAGHPDKFNKNWKTLRQHRRLKEEVFTPFLEKYGSRRPGGGRDLLMKEALRNYRGLLARCPELQALQKRIKNLLRWK